MQRVKFLFQIVSFVILTSYSLNKPAYQIFNQDGEKVSYEKWIEEMSKADIILFGELHNNPIIHWLQFELTKEIYENYNDSLVLGAEMYESDNQLLIDEYLGGYIDYKTLNNEAKLWPNDKTDYKPLLDFAKDNHFTFVAANIPRRYASMVSKDGFEAFDNLEEEARKFIAPLPLKYDEELPGYVKMRDMMGAMGHSTSTPENMAKAQASKDATMAHFILKNWKKGQTFIHYNGSYHSMNYEGIGWYLKQANPELNVLTIHAVEQDNLDTLTVENLNTANFIIATPSTMTKTH